MQLLEEIARLGSDEQGGRQWYQFIDFGDGITNEKFGHGGKKMIHRTNLFLGVLETYPFAKTDRVLDIGSNAGLFSFLTAPKVADVIGVEFRPTHHQQALFVKRYFESTGKNLSNVRLCNDDITKQLDLFKDRTLIFASKVLYHKFLGVEGAANVMNAIQSSPARAVIFQGHNSKTGKGTWRNNDDITEQFVQRGFSFEIVRDDPEYPVAIARR